jgi:hypothetical protein
MVVAGVGHELLSKRKSDDLPNRVVKAFLDFVEA